MNRKRRIAVVALAIVGVSAAAAAAAPHAVDQRPHHDPPGAAKPTRTVEHDAVFGRSVTVRQVDRRRGLIFVLDGSAVMGSGLAIKLAAGAPRATRDALLSRPLAATCHVPGTKVHEFAGRWNARFRQFGTALTTDDPAINVADRATDCVLYVGREGATSDTAYFDGPPFSRVRMR